MSKIASRELVARVAQSRGLGLLPDNAQWTNRFHVRSETSSRLYTIAQRKSDGSWGCDCMGWIRHKRCKHLNRIVPLLGR